MPYYSYTSNDTKTSANGSSGNDTITAIANNKTASQGQIHVWANGGNDTINIQFGAGIATNAKGVAQGHHVRGDQDADASYFHDSGSDIFNFKDTRHVGSNKIVVGRIEDFDMSRDTLKIEGGTITAQQLKNGSGTTSGLGWKIVDYNGSHDDAGALPQKWIVITTSTGGKVFYALGGARIDMDGTGKGNGGEQETHFLNAFRGEEPSISQLNAMKATSFVDPHNFIPAQYDGRAASKYYITDYDNTAAEVLTVIRRNDDASQGDYIAAGLNDDRVEARAGNDMIWGGDGHDTLYGQAGDDTLSGNYGNDSLIGGTGADEYRFLTGENGQDTIEGFTLSDGDTIVLDGQTIDVATKVAQANGGDTGSNLKINLGSGTYVTLKNYDIRETDTNTANTNVVMVGPDTRTYGTQGEADIFTWDAKSINHARISGFENDVDKLDISFWGVTTLSELTFTAFDGKTYVDVSGNGTSARLMHFGDI